MHSSSCPCALLGTYVFGRTPQADYPTRSTAFLTTLCCRCNHHRLSWATLLRSRVIGHVCCLTSRKPNCAHSTPVPAMYTLALKKPILSEVLPCPTVTARRPLQSLPFGIETVYTLSIPVQTGGQWRSHVWLATPPSKDGYPNSRHVVLKFIIPSHLELPALDTQANGAMPSLGRYYRYPDDIVAEGVKAYDSLPELQGATLPYFYGSFQVCPFTHGWLR